MTVIHRGQALKGEFTVNPDREMLVCALALGALARGRTLLEECPATPVSNNFAEWLHENGVSLQHKSNAWEIEGVGLQWNSSPLQTLPKNFFAKFIALCILSRDHETCFDFGTQTAEDGTEALLQEHFQGSWQNSRWLFGEVDLKVRISPSGEVPHLSKIRLLLQAIVHERSLYIEEKTSCRDQLSSMLTYFGAPLTVEQSGQEEMDELARRMARLQGQKQDRKTLTKLAACKFLTGKDYFVPGDPTEATALTLQASLLPDSSITIRNICLNPSRAGAFNALKRMGAELEVVQKKERFGDQFGSLRVQSCKRMVGRKMTSELLLSCLEEIPLLAVAACLAEGETILRLPEHVAAEQRVLLDCLAANLKLAGIEVGVYEEGLVVRGREEVDANAFTYEKPAALGLAFAVLARVAHGQ